MGCTQCHVADWNIRPQAGPFAGDRRLFDFVTRYDAEDASLSGELVPQYMEVNGRKLPLRQGFAAQGMFTDFRHHDLGLRSREIGFGGTVNTLWRTHRCGASAAASRGSTTELR